MKYLYEKHGQNGEHEKGEVYTPDWLDRKVRAFLIDDSFHKMEITKDKSESVEDIVIHYLEWLAKKMRGDTPEEELEDTDLGWYISHVESTIVQVDMARNKRVE